MELSKQYFMGFFAVIAIILGVSGLSDAVRHNHNRYRHNHDYKKDHHGHGG